MICVISMFRRVSGGLGQSRLRPVPSQPISSYVQLVVVTRQTPPLPSKTRLNKKLYLRCYSYYYDNRKQVNKKGNVALICFMVSFASWCASSRKCAVHPENTPQKKNTINRGIIWHCCRNKTVNFATSTGNTGQFSPRCASPRKYT